MEEGLFFVRTRRVAAGASAMVSILAALALSCAFPARAASFDCAKAATAVEKTICADAELSKLDEELAGAYTDALDRAADPATVKTAQRTWLRNTRDACTDSVCLKRVYWARIGSFSCATVEKRNCATPRPELIATAGYIDEDRLFTHGRPAGMYALAEDNDPSVCDPLFDSLSSAWDASRQRGPYIFMRNEYLIQPWEDRTFSWQLPGSAELKRRHWEAAFVDASNNGKEDALFRAPSMIGGNFYHVFFLLPDADPVVETEEPLSLKRAKQIHDNGRVSFEKFDSYPHSEHQLIELVRIKTKVYMLIGRAFYWDTDQDSRMPKVQLLTLHDGKLRRVCMFDGLIAIRKTLDH